MGTVLPGFSQKIIYINAFCTGAIIMSFEMLGSRYLSPYFGSGIFTWAALISTILLALSMGYFLGGSAADRRPSLAILGSLITVSSVYILLIPTFQHELQILVLEHIQDVRYGSLVAATILMVFPVTLLGAYSPFAIRLILRSTEESGRVAGRVYGVSTFGSIVGTLGTTFFLIPAIGSTAITWLLGIIGLAVGTSLFILDRKSFSGRSRARPSVIGIFVASIVFCNLTNTADAQDNIDIASLKKLPNGLLEKIETEYNNIFITKSGFYIKMAFQRYGNNYTESVINLDNEKQLPVPYTQQMTVGLIYPSQLRSMVMIGLGGGTTTSYMLNFVPQLAATIVELDPGVVVAAKKYFGLKESQRLKIRTSDGRVFLRRDRNSYDLIMVDAFRGGYVPFHLLTREFYKIVAGRLTDHGAAVFNVHSGTRLFAGTIRTLREVFESVDFYKTGAGNIIIVAHNGPQKPLSELKAKALELQTRLKLPYDISRYSRVPIHDASLLEATVLTDDFAPANYYEAIRLNNQRRW